MGCRPKETQVVRQTRPMARELGLNPDKLGKIDNHKQEAWKAPLPQFIEEIYFKRFKREEPLSVKPLKEIIADNKVKAEKKKKEKDKKRKLAVQSGDNTQTNNNTTLSDSESSSPS
jgi:hypothetical protein